MSVCGICIASRSSKSAAAGTVRTAPIDEEDVEGVELDVQDADDEDCDDQPTSERTRTSVRGALRKGKMRITSKKYRSLRK